MHEEDDDDEEAEEQVVVDRRLWLILNCEQTDEFIFNLWEVNEAKFGVEPFIVNEYGCWFWWRFWCRRWLSDVSKRYKSFCCWWERWVGVVFNEWFIDDDELSNSNGSCMLNGELVEDLFNVGDGSIWFGLSLKNIFKN